MLGVVDEARTTARDGHAAWSESFNEMLMQVAGMYSNARVRRRGRTYLLGLLSRAERKNSWQLAEFAGNASPDGIQRLLNFSPRDEDAARDALGRYVVNPMGDPAAVPAVDETGFVKRGRMSACRPGCIPGLQAGWRTARSACSRLTSRRRAGVP
jgi:SRSO17 transposase